MEGTKGKLHWELWEPSKSHTQVFSYNGINNSPFILQTLIFNALEFHPLEVFFELPEQSRKP